MRSFVVLLATIMLVTAAGAARSAPAPAEFGRVVISNYSQKAGLAPVVFDHWVHRAQYTCRLCHVDIGLGMKANLTEIRAADNMKGVYCGICHNGKMQAGGKAVFAACSADRSDMLPEADSIEALNQQRLAQCLAYGDHRLQGREQTVNELFREEQASLLPLPAGSFTVTQIRIGRVDHYATVRADKNRYSVHSRYVGLKVQVHLDIDRVDLFHGGKKLATHSRVFGNNKWQLDPDHYLELIQQRPYAFQAARPIRQWREHWPPVLEKLLLRFQESQGNTGGIKDFISVLMLRPATRCTGRRRGRRASPTSWPSTTPRARAAPRSARGATSAARAGEQVGSVPGFVQAALPAGEWSDHPIDALGNRTFYPTGVALPANWLAAGTPNSDRGAEAFHAAGAPTCSYCHDTHGGIAGQAILRGPITAAGDYTFSYGAWCFVCHTADQVIPLNHHSNLQNMNGEDVSQLDSYSKPRAEGKSDLHPRRWLLGSPV